MRSHSKNVVLVIKNVVLVIKNVGQQIFRFRMHMFSISLSSPTVKRPSAVLKNYHYTIAKRKTGSSVCFENFNSFNFRAKRRVLKSPQFTNGTTWEYKADVWAEETQKNHRKLLREQECHISLGFNVLGRKIYSAKVRRRIHECGIVLAEITTTAEGECNATS